MVPRRLRRGIHYTERPETLGYLCILHAEVQALIVRYFTFEVLEGEFSDGGLFRWEDGGAGGRGESFVGRFF